MNKELADFSLAVAGIPDGATIAVGGFGLCGIPSALIGALVDSGARDLKIVSNNCGVDDWGLGLLLKEHRIVKMTSSYVGENKEFERQYLSGELEVELVPQGTLAERLRAGGSGIPAFYTPAGVGTQIANGGVPLRFDSAGIPILMSEPKEVREFNGRKYVLELGITTDFALVRASKGDRHGNLVYQESTQNFNPLVAMAGRVTIAEVEELVDPGDIPPAQVHTPGIFVQHVISLSPAQVQEKRIERRTTLLNDERDFTSSKTG